MTNDRYQKLDSIGKLRLYKIVFWPIMILAGSFVLIFILLSQAHKIKESKDLNQELEHIIGAQESYMADEIVLKEYQAIKMRLQSTVNSVAALHNNSSICISVMPIYPEIKNGGIIIYCNKESTIKSFVKEIGVSSKRLYVAGEQLAVIKYRAVISPKATDYLPLDLLGAIISSIFLTFISFYFLIKKIQKNIITPFQIAIEEEAKNSAFSEIALQVAHDIRSPLITLNCLLSQLANFPEGKRILFRNAICRITNIANNLLSKYQANNNLQNLPRPELISEILFRLISEKRTQYQSIEDKIKLIVADESYCIFAKIFATAFNQAISNIIDNAMEAIDVKVGQVTVKLGKKDDQHLEISIEDNGCGISSDLISKILKEGLSNKKYGHGIGLVTAKKIIEDCHGSLEIISQLNIGTNIFLVIPICQTPEWFTNLIYISNETLVVILDDEQQIHDVWDEYFKAKIKLDYIELSHFYSPSDLLQLDLSEYKNHTDVVYLIDYEFLNYDNDGLDIIEKMDIAEKSILVTNRYDDAFVREKAEKMFVKIMPKSLVLYNQINIISRV